MINCTVWRMLAPVNCLDSKQRRLLPPPPLSLSSINLSFLLTSSPLVSAPFCTLLNVFSSHTQGIFDYTKLDSASMRVLVMRACKRVHDKHVCVPPLDFQQFFLSWFWNCTTLCGYLSKHFTVCGISSCCSLVVATSYVNIFRVNFERRIIFIYACRVLGFCAPSHQGRF